MTKKLTPIDRLVRAAPRSGAGWAALILSFTGFGLMVVMEFAGANLALRTSASTLDAVLKIAFSVAFGLAFFFGAIVTAAKMADDRKYVRKGIALAWLVTAACFCVASVNFASYVAFARAEKAAAETRESPAYAAAVADYADAKRYARNVASDFTVAGSAEEDVARIEKMLATGEAPRAVVWFVHRDDLRAGEVSVSLADLLLAFLSGGVVMGLGSAYRMPKVPVRRQQPAQRKAASRAPRARKGEPKLAVVK